MAKSKSKSIRLSLEDWAEVEYAAALHGWGVNDEIKDRIHRLAVDVPAEVSEGCRGAPCHVLSAAKV